MEFTLGVIFKIAVILFSAITHEIAHGAIALRLGDPTAKMAGRLTFNPIRHLDLFGSIILPFILIIFSGTPFGWAKPVPYNPYNFKNPRKGSLVVALAGPLTNFAIAAIFSAAIRIMVIFEVHTFANGALVVAFFAIMLINLILGIFNLLPLPPLDGSKMLFYFFPRLEHLFARIGPFILLLLIFYIAPTIIEPLLAAGLWIVIDVETFETIAPFLARFRFLFA